MSAFRPRTCWTEAQAYREIFFHLYLNNYSSQTIRWTKMRKLVIVVKTPRQKDENRSVTLQRRRGKKNTNWIAPINKPHWLSTWNVFRSRIDSIQINSHWVRFYWIVKRKQEPLIFAGLYLFMISRSCSYGCYSFSNLQSHFI